MAYCEICGEESDYEIDTDKFICKNHSHEEVINFLKNEEDIEWRK